MRVSEGIQNPYFLSMVRMAPQGQVPEQGEDNSGDVKRDGEEKGR